jgi:hypothetical protein
MEGQQEYDVKRLKRLRWTRDFSGVHVPKVVLRLLNKVLYKLNRFRAIHSLWANLLLFIWALTDLSIHHNIPPAPATCGRVHFYRSTTATDVKIRFIHDNNISNNLWLDKMCTWHDLALKFELDMRHNLILNFVDIVSAELRKFLTSRKEVRSTFFFDRRFAEISNETAAGTSFDCLHQRSCVAKCTCISCSDAQRNGGCLLTIT